MTVTAARARSVADSREALAAAATVSRASVVAPAAAVRVAATSAVDVARKLLTAVAVSARAMRSVSVAVARSLAKFGVSVASGPVGVGLGDGVTTGVRDAVGLTEGLLVGEPVGRGRAVSINWIASGREGSSNTAFSHVRTASSICLNPTRTIP